MRLLEKEEINHITTGATILGSGGGGDPYIGKIMAFNAIKKYGPVRLLTVDELESEALIVSTGMIGSPAVLIEKVPQGEEGIIACKLIEEHLNRKISAVCPFEPGGLNSLITLAIATQLGISVVDVDPVGRAFPEIHMTTLSLDGISASPFTLVDVKGNKGLIQAEDNYTTERLARVLCEEMGSTAFFAAYPITAYQAKKSGILGTLTLAQQIGETVEQASSAKTNVVQALLNLLEGFILFHGKISRLDQRNNGGFTSGSVCFNGVDADKCKEFEVLFQNEYLLAQSAGCLLCSTPDLIILLDEETGIPILTERLRYGARVMVLGVPANEKWYTPHGIEVAGPRYFNYSVDFRPVEELVGTNKKNKNY